MARSLGAYGEARLFLPRDGVGTITLTAGYDLSLLHYRELDRRVTGHLASLGLRFVR